jgi:hypothetical protein
MPAAADTDPIPLARRQVRAPALALIAVAVLQIVYLVIMLVILISGQVGDQFDQEREKIEKNAQLNPVDRDLALNVLNGYEQFIAVAYPCDLALCFVAAIVILLGAGQMLKLSSRGWARTSAILSMIPCFTCCIWGIPLGMWAILVLIRPEVKRGFEAMAQQNRPADDDEDFGNEWEVEDK